MQSLKSATTIHKMQTFVHKIIKKNYNERRNCSSRKPPLQTIVTTYYPLNLKFKLLYSNPIPKRLRIHELRAAFHGIRGTKSSGRLTRKAVTRSSGRATQKGEKGRWQIRRRDRSRGFGSLHSRVRRGQSKSGTECATRRARNEHTEKKRRSRRSASARKE